ncbi:MAG: 23S rRNA (guanosine(2251)-2'-O)-methyltransferase RlmB [Anaerolineaceae bacterium]|nr:23S rRNA (guanosine(2251)-2'-O)-methyltransferase RlmB [Anaerolineaceae bacterium]
MKEFITGRNPVFEVLHARRRHVFQLRIASGVQRKGRMEDILELARKVKLPVVEVERRQLDQHGDNHQGVVLETSQYPYCHLKDIIERAEKRSEPLFILILDIIQNPQNFGTLLRTAETVGVHGTIIPTKRATGVTPAVVHASAGATEHMRIVQANLAQVIELIKKENAWIIGLEGSDETQPIEQTRLDGPLAIVVGSEGEGLRPLVRKSCDVLARLNMRGKVGSMNASVAGSIALYLAMQQRIAKK